jgi:diacylglycerol kinase (ATP)
MTHPSPKHIALICNPTFENEKALKTADDVAKLLRQKEIRTSIFIKEWPTAWDGITGAWIFGGDGTLYHFINQYPDIQIPLSAFRAGSGNDFHWMLYGDISHAEQTERLLQGNTQAIDAGTCNGKLFLNGVGIGFDGAIVKDLLGKKKVAGKSSYLITILKNIIAYREGFYNIDLGSKGLSQDCFMISVANGQRYGGGFKVAPRASLIDGLLDVNIISKVSPFKRLKLLPVVERGEHLDLPVVSYHQKEKLIIKTSTEVHAHLDGEYLFAKEFHFNVLPKKFVFSV